ncbi:hypothetical protein TwortDSMZ_197 [Staphylococcus phage Twort]|uniref:Uncharacterized protein n=2 Tax=Staphylococcus phage Twort (strain DSM 17442 / HER 48) TaxID=2908167 RepID=A0A6H0X5M4_BPTWO|nr:ORF227 [Staphylococcus phage Twort]AAX92469.1 ORF227 [Staphylococcus phage Twort]QIW89202.1 hypothetical protein TwortDSMZ_008 [Staphylococcus phage Twort]QIW89219.1 hypothetical protein TwortDSMZ_197 [Staphylococcus phage Twort]
MILILVLLTINLICLIIIGNSILELEGKRALVNCILFSVPVIAIVVCIYSLVLECWL